MTPPAVEAMRLRFDRSLLADFERASSLEWLETNGLGGWASSTVAGAHSRRYHGLLVAARSPVARDVLLSKLDETLHVAGTAFELGANRYPGAIHPQGHRYLTSFERDLFPVFEYQAGGARLRKTVACPDGENTTLLLYELNAAAGPVELELRPLVAGRGYHELRSAGGAPDVAFRDGVLGFRFADPALDFSLSAPGASFSPAPDWYHRFEYEVERFRGLDFREDLWTPGALRLSLRPGEPVGILVTTGNAGRDVRALFERERERRLALVAAVPSGEGLAARLTLAADQFIVRRGAGLRTVIAGYHWFGDWGRDTMIALPGLCMATGRYGDAKLILRAFAESVSQGMLPNRFTDRDEAPEYNTVDATLWFFVAIHHYLRGAGDDAWVLAELLPVLRDVVAWHERGTRYGIRVDEDGLLAAGEPGVQLTWMDAKVGDWVVTPRHGKAVEINALWYNALRILANLERLAGDEFAGARCERLADRVRRRFNELFWNEQSGCLYDVVAAGRSDPTLRPNQIFALSLPVPLLAKKRSLAVLDVVERRLLTPFGLRSLDPGSPDYRPAYGGGVLERDGAYHQGTVWSWLLGPFISALVRFRGARGRRQARALVAGIEAHLAAAGVGTISEIFDAEPPHAPRGCIAQAWGVAELLRAWSEELRGADSSRTGAAAGAARSRGAS